MAAVHRSSRAEFDLVEIWTNIANDDPLAADSQLDRIDEACTMLAQYPHSGPKREDLAPALRFYPVGNYLIFFTIADDGINVVRVLHGARDYPREFW
jgi:toxin ParE1/3/4